MRQSVMVGLVLTIHAFLRAIDGKTRMAGPSPALTE
jgi:hypothetical protein